MNNVINRFLLRIFLFPTTLYKRFGVDLHQLKAILTAKLIMDDRRASGLYKARQRNKDSEVKMATLFTMFVSLIMGGIFLFSFTIENDVTRMTLYFSFLIIMLSLFLITDFTHVLMDVKDNFIILPKPVSAATFVTARLMHILIHITKIIVPMSIPGLIAMWITRGAWGSIVLIPIIALVTLFTIFLVNGAYLVIMKIFSPERFKSIITSIQIGFTIIVYAGFQILPRMIESETIEQLDISKFLWLWAIPSYWFGGAWTFLYSFAFSFNLLICTLLAITVPFISIWIVIKYFAPTFQRKLSMIASSGAAESTTTATTTSKNKSSENGFTASLAKFFTRKGSERGAFRFTWIITGRSRDFKMRVLPQIGYMAVIIVIMFFRNRGHQPTDDGPHVVLSPVFPILAMIYLSSFVYLAALFQLANSDSFKASWIYFTTPQEKPGTIISGSIKATLVKFCIPIMFIVAVTGIILRGFSLIPNLIFGFSNVILICSLMSYFIMEKLPFSVSSKSAGEGSGTAKRMLMMLTLPLCGIPHYFLFDYPSIELAISVFTLGVSWMLLRGIREISWADVNEMDWV